jgi:hypothetical protein
LVAGLETGRILPNDAGNLPSWDERQLRPCLILTATLKHVRERHPGPLHVDADAIVLRWRFGELPNDLKRLGST